MSIELKRLRFTAHDVQEMIATGIIAGDARIELWDGDIIEMSPIGGLHHFAVSILVAAFGKLGHDRKIGLGCQGPLRLDDTTILQPDIAITKPDSSLSRTGLPLASETLLVIEVSDTTYATDRHRKAVQYAAAGIPEYWIVNIARREVEVLRAPRDNNYTQICIARGGETISPAAVPDVAIRADDLFPPRE